jgi:hypothetical protein
MYVVCGWFAGKEVCVMVFDEVVWGRTFEDTREDFVGVRRQQSESKSDSLSYLVRSLRLGLGVGVGLGRAH